MAHMSSKKKQSKSLSASILDSPLIDTSYLTQTSSSQSVYTLPLSASTISIGGTSGSGFWSQTNGTTYSDISDYSSTRNTGIDLKGDADIRIDGVSLKNFMATVEERLALLTPNPEIEKEWAELKELGDKYRALEKEIKEKMKTWDILKREDNPGK